VGMKKKSDDSNLEGRRKGMEKSGYATEDSSLICIKAFVAGLY
jgi:hypothetical protein